MKSSLITTALAVALAGAFLACDKKPAEIKIGGVGPLTGEAATFGVSTKNGYDMAIAECNAKGGVLGKQVKLVFADDKGDPAEGATVYTKLIEQDKVSAIIGTVMSKSAWPVPPSARTPRSPTSSPPPPTPRSPKWATTSSAPRSSTPSRAPWAPSSRTTS